MGEEVKAGPVVPESVLKKRKREEQWALAKKQGLESAKKKNSENRKLIYNRAKQYAKEYDEQVHIQYPSLNIVQTFFFICRSWTWAWFSWNLFVSKRSWLVWSVRRSWRVGFMSTQRPSCCSLSGFVGMYAFCDISYGFFYLVSLWLSVCWLWFLSSWVFIFWNVQNQCHWPKN